MPRIEGVEIPEPLTIKSTEVKASKGLPLRSGRSVRIHRLG
jgi:hypothetical protein